MLIILAAVSVGIPLCITSDAHNIHLKVGHWLRLFDLAWIRDENDFELKLLRIYENPFGGKLVKFWGRRVVELLDEGKTKSSYGRYTWTLYKPKGASKCASKQSSSDS